MCILFNIDLNARKESTHFDNCFLYKFLPEKQKLVLIQQIKL